MTLLEAIERTERELPDYLLNPDEFLNHLIELRAMCLVDKPDSLALKHLRRATELLTDATEDIDIGLGLAEASQALKALRPPRSHRIKRSLAELRALGVGEAQIARILKETDPLWTLPDEPKREDAGANIPEEIKRDILEGVPLRAISANHNIPIEDVREYAKLLNADVCETAGQLSPRLKSEAIEMYESDNTLDYATIAKRLTTADRKCPESQIRDVLIAHIRAKETGERTDAGLELTKEVYETTLEDYRSGVPVSADTDEFIANLEKKSKKKSKGTK